MLTFKINDLFEINPLVDGHTKMIAGYSVVHTIFNQNIKTETLIIQEFIS